MGPLGKHIVCWVGTAPDKHADVPFNVPFRVANTTDAAKLDTTGEEEKTGGCWQVEGVRVIWGGQHPGEHAVHLFRCHGNPRYHGSHHRGEIIR